jgi:hypothetical protein
MGVGAAPANEPMFRIRPFLLMGYPEHVSAWLHPDAGALRKRRTDRETMEGAIRLVTRSVAVTLTLMMVASSSGDVSTKSAGNSWDTPTLLTVLYAAQNQLH